MNYPALLLGCFLRLPRSAVDHESFGSLPLTTKGLISLFLFQEIQFLTKRAFSLRSNRPEIGGELPYIRIAYIFTTILIEDNRLGIIYKRVIDPML